jgi:hypothetical protein
MLMISPRVYVCVCVCVCGYTRSRDTSVIRIARFGLYYRIFTSIRNVTGRVREHILNRIKWRGELAKVKKKKKTF